MIVVKSPIHPDGWKFVGIFAGVTAILFFLSDFLGLVGLVLTVWCFYFFRHPKRTTPLNDDLIISPADGRICLIEEKIPPSELGMGHSPLWRVSIFLSVFDVHVNRSPWSGVVEAILYHPGQFFNASLDKSSDLNERQTIVVNKNGVKIAFVQIAGLIARRIRCDVQVGQMLQTGQPYGLIRFGSRMDVYLPETVCPQVIVGQRAIAGETILGTLGGNSVLPVGIAR